MTAQVVLYPDSRQGFVLLANDTCAATEGVLKDLARAVHETLAPVVKAAKSSETQVTRNTHPLPPA